MIYVWLKRRAERRARDKLILDVMHELMKGSSITASGLKTVVSGQQMILENLNTVMLGVIKMAQAAGTLTEEIQRLKDEVTNARGVRDSVLVLINGIPAIIQTAIDNALAKGATPEQLQSIQDAVDELASNDSAILDAVHANQPAPVAPTPADAAGGSNPHTDAPADSGVPGGQADPTAEGAVTG